MDFTRPVRITASAVVSATGARLRIVHVGKAVASGTVSIYDDTTTSSPSNLRATVPLDTPQSWFFDGCRFDNGIAAVISGASPDVTFIVE